MSNEQLEQAPPGPDAMPPAQEQVAEEQAPAADAGIEGVETDAMGAVMLGAVVEMGMRIGGAVAKVTAPIVAPVASAMVSAGVAVGLLSYTNNAPAAVSANVQASAPETPGAEIEPQQDVSMNTLIEQAVNNVQKLSGDVLSAVNEAKSTLMTQAESVGASPESMKELAPQDLGSNLVANVSQDIGVSQGIGRTA